MVFKRKFKKTSSHWGNPYLLIVTYHKVIYMYFDLYKICSEFGNIYVKSFGRNKLSQTGNMKTEVGPTRGKEENTGKR